MSAVDDYVRNNEEYALTHVGGRPVQPAKHVAIVACMDSRMRIFPLLGMGDGEAHVIRNAGGVVTDDVIRSLSISQRLLGTREIMLIHHTDCGLQKTTEDEFKGTIEAETGIRPHWAVEAFTDAEQDVRQSIGRIKASPFIPHKDSIRGFVFDVATGKLNEVI
ncbi:MAG TPA: carbonic anhydrase [Trebonia sp.]|jgi:carbonic anhydrase